MARLQANSRFWLAAALLAVALATRVVGAWYARFDIDEAQLWTAALDVAEGRTVPVFGPGVSGSDSRTPGSFYYTLMALPFLITVDPLAGALFVAAIGVAGLWLTFRAIGEGWDETAALIFLSLATLSPILVTFSDRHWSSNLFAPFAGLVLLSLVRVLKNENSPWIAAVAFSICVVPQVHIAFVGFVGVIGLALAVYRPRLHWRALVLGILAAAAFYAPYVLHELRTGFENTRALAAGGVRSDRVVGAVAGSLLHFLAIGTTDPSYLLARGHFSGFHHVAFWAHGGVARTQAFYGSTSASVFLWLTQACGWLLIAYGLPRLRIARDRPFALFFWASVGSILLFALASGRVGFTHYVLPWAPLAFVPAIAALRALQSRGRWGRALAIAYCVAAPIAGAFVLRGHYAVDSRQSIPQQERIVSYIHEKVGGRAFHLVLAFDDARPQTYGVLAKRLYRVPWRPHEKAADVFTVVPRPEWEAGRRKGAAPDVLVLDTLVVLHTIR